jgi:hypothetical protein
MYRTSSGAKKQEKRSDERTESSRAICEKLPMMIMAEIARWVV